MPLFKGAKRLSYRHSTDDVKYRTCRFFDFETSELLLDRCRAEKIYAFEPDQECGIVIQFYILILKEALCLE